MIDMAKVNRHHNEVFEEYWEKNKMPADKEDQKIQKAIARLYWIMSVNAWNEAEDDS